MPSLLIPDLSADLLARLESVARAHRRPVGEEAARLLERGIDAESPRVPVRPAEIFLTEEIPAPFDLPRPPGVQVPYIDGGTHWPKPLAMEFLIPGTQEGRPDGDV